MSSKQNDPKRRPRVGGVAPPPPKASPQQARAGGASLSGEGARRARRRRKGVIALVCAGSVCLVGAVAAERAVRGGGRLHHFALTAYRNYKADRLQSAYAAQFSPLTVARIKEPLLAYDNGKLSEGWQDWSWAAHDLAAPSGGKKNNAARAIRMEPEGNKGVYLHHDAFGTDGYGVLEAYYYAPPGLNAATPNLKLVAVDGGGGFGQGVSLEKYGKSASEMGSGWKVARVPFKDLHVAALGASLSGVVVQAGGPERQPDILIGRIALLPDPALAAQPAEIAVTVQVDTGANRIPISPFIYGMAFAPPDYVSDLRLGLNRWGGNDKTRYNWAHGNASNAARDWNFANKTASDMPATEKTGPSSGADWFTRNNRGNGSQTMLTIPTIGWVAKDTDNSHHSENVPSGGVGIGPEGAEGAIAGYDPATNRARTSVRSRARKGAAFTDTPSPAADTVYQDEWVAHLVKTFGAASRGGVSFYAMDNEPDLWAATHTDVHPALMGYDDMLARYLEYARAVKDVDPSAQITGPVSWGWIGYQYSSLDQGADNYHTHADRKKHGDTPFLLWFLQNVRVADATSGKNRRTLDVLDVHYYPQGANLYSAAADPGTRARRVRSTRSLWDPAYTDESWIGEPVRLIPRLKEWVASGYPGTKIGITEWNFGADHDISGALAIAEMLGVCGREGVYLANYWAYPLKNSPGYLAFKIFRNPDGEGGGMNDISCKAVSSAPDLVSCFAATGREDDSDLTLILCNKMPETTASVSLTLPRGIVLPAKDIVASDAPVGAIWRIAGEKPTALAALPLSVLRNAPGGAVSLPLPPYSVTLLRLPKRRTATTQGGKVGK